MTNAKTNAMTTKAPSELTIRELRKAIDFAYEIAFSASTTKATSSALSRYTALVKEMKARGRR